MIARKPDDPTAGAAATLHEVDDVRQETRRLVNAAWFPLLLWGTIVLASAPAILAGGAVIAFYWLVAAPAGLLLTARFFRRRSFEHGLASRHWRIYRGLGVAIAVVCFALGAAGSEIVSAVGPMYAVGVGVLVFAALSRVASYAFAAAVLIVAATLILVGDPGDPALAAALVEGGVLLAAGLAVLLSGGLRTSPGADARRVRTG